MSIYRANEGVEHDSFKEIQDRDTRRPPSNVPYVVDNLWEWERKNNWKHFPNRRHSKFASPKPEQALRSTDLLEDCLKKAGLIEKDVETEGLPEECLKHVSRVEFVGEPVIAQLPGWEDAKKHPDCDNLRTILFKKLGGKYTWCGRDLIKKHPAGQLFQPCLSAEEVGYLLDTTEELKQDKEEIQDEIEYWGDLALIDPDLLADEEEGEILFEFRAFDGRVGYHRRPVENGR